MTKNKNKMIENVFESVYKQKCDSVAKKFNESINMNRYQKEFKIHLINDELKRVL